MESMKMRGTPKIPVAKQSSTASAKKSSDKKFTEEENKTISELKKLYLETIKLDVDLQQEIYNMEKSFEAKHKAIFEKRYNILEDFRKKSHGNSSSESNISNFWLRVLKASYTEFISKKDEKILTYLTDIRSKLCNEPTVKFIIEFHFEPNEFFSNRILTKTYFLNCLPDVDDPLSYDGAEIYKCEGCKIGWKQKINEKDKKASFFDFFSPPKLPDDTEDPNYCDINAILQNDFELGFYLKERVIPKAVMFFTGEIADCQSSDSESESEDTDDDDDDDDDDDNFSTNDVNEE